MNPCEVHISKPRTITNSNVPMLEQVVSKKEIKRRRTACSFLSLGSFKTDEANLEASM